MAKTFLFTPVLPWSWNYLRVQGQISSYQPTVLYPRRRKALPQMNRVSPLWHTSRVSQREFSWMNPSLSPPQVTATSPRCRRRAACSASSSPSSASPSHSRSSSTSDRQDDDILQVLSQVSWTLRQPGRGITQLRSRTSLFLGTLSMRFHVNKLKVYNWDGNISQKITSMSCVL